MRYLYFLLLILLPIASLQAQTCTIKISYDDNGNRILRELACLSPRPGDEDNPDEQLPRSRKTLLSDSSTVAGNFTVYPNPTSNEVFVELDALSLLQKCTILLVDQLGREHFRKERPGARTAIELSHLPDGLYYILLWRNEQKSTVKIVKEAYQGR